LIDHHKQINPPKKEKKTKNVTRGERRRRVKKATRREDENKERGEREIKVVERFGGVWLRL
jgi:hypothetical protein